MGWERVGGVLCPGLDALPSLRSPGTPRDRPTAVECPRMLPTELTAQWLTRVLYAGGFAGPHSAAECARTAVVRRIDSCVDVSNDGTVFRLSVSYGAARGRPVEATLNDSDQAFRLPKSYILKLYDNTQGPTLSARGNDEQVSGSASIRPCSTPAHVPVCYWSCIVPPSNCRLEPQVKVHDVTLLQWLREEQWCALDPNIKRRNALDAIARRQAAKQLRQEQREERWRRQMNDDNTDNSTNEDDTDSSSESDDTADEADLLTPDEAGWDYFVDDEGERIEIYDRYYDQLRSVLGIRANIVEYLRILERPILEKDSVIEARHIDTLMNARQKCLDLTAPRQLGAAILLEDIR